MWRKAVPYLVIASLALNLAFVAVWMTRAWADHVPAAGAPDDDSPVWCPLHRELEVTPQQWTEIEPQLRQFQADVNELRQRTQSLRADVIEMLAAESPDLEAIRAKQDEILNTKRQIQQRVLDHLLAEKEILTAEQEAMLFARLREHTGCAGRPPMSGGGVGRAFRNDENEKRKAQ